MVERHVGWEVCGEAVNGFDAVQKNRSLAPHFIIMDMSMPGMTGIEAAYEILKESPKVPIVMLTLYLTTQLSQEALDIGVRGTLGKAAMDHLIDGMDRVLRGKEFIAGQLNQ